MGAQMTSQIINEKVTAREPKSFAKPESWW
jgi:hypothetical protein